MKYPIYSFILLFLSLNVILGGVVIEDLTKDGGIFDYDTRTGGCPISLYIRVSNVTYISDQNLFITNAEPGDRLSYTCTELKLQRVLGSQFLYLCSITKAHGSSGFLSIKATYTYLETSEMTLYNISYYHCGLKSGDPSNLQGLPSKKLQRYNWKDFILPATLDNFCPFSKLTSTIFNNDIPYQYSGYDNKGYTTLRLIPNDVSSISRNQMVIPILHNGTTTSFNVSSFFTQNVNTTVTAIEYYPVTPNPVFYNVKQIVGIFDIENYTSESYAGFSMSSKILYERHNVVLKTPNTLTVLWVYPLPPLTNFYFAAFNGSEMQTLISITYSMESSSTLALLSANTYLTDEIFHVQTQASGFDLGSCSYKRYFDNFEVPFKYPFGYKDITYNNNMFLLKVDYLLEPLQSTFITVYSICIDKFNSPISSGGQVSETPTGGSYDLIVPVLNSFDYFYLEDRKIVISLNLSDDGGSGLFMAQIRSEYGDSQEFYLIEHLVSGSMESGIFEMVLDIDASQPNSIYIFDAASNMVSKAFNGIINGDRIDELDQYLLDLWFSVGWQNFGVLNVTQILFKTQNPDLTKQSNDNILYVNYQGANRHHVVTLQLELPYGPGEVIHYGKWNNALGFFEIPFTLPANLISGVLGYNLTLNYQLIPSTILNEIYPESTLTIQSESGDHFPPYVADIIYAYPPNNSVISNDIVINITVTIVDQVNGFKGGMLAVKSNNFQKLFEIKLDPSQLISGDKYQGNYQLLIPFKGSTDCAVQMFTVYSGYLQDEGGFIADSEDINSPHPLFKLRDERGLKIDCLAGPPTEYIPVNISTIAVTPTTMDVTSSQRTLSVAISATTKPPSINISSQHLPSVYLTSVSLNHEIPCQINVYQGPQCNYTCKGEVPFGFGYPTGFFVSVYGLTNIALQVNAYTGFEVREIDPTQYLVQTTSVSPIPYIQTISPLDPVKLDVTVTGAYLSLSSFDAYVNYGSGYVKLPPPKKLSGSIYILSGFSKPTIPSQLLTNSGVDKISNGVNALDDNIQLKLINENGESNIVSLIVDTDVFILPMNQITCQNDCGGSDQGECLPDNKGCKCIYPYSGIDCLSKVKEDIQVSINESSPQYSALLTNGDNSRFDVLIKIVGLRELSFDDTVVNEWKLEMNQWNYSDISKDGKKQYQYSLNLDHKNVTTEIVAVLEYFDSITTTEFGGKNIDMNPFTYKYKITMTPYSFSSKLNTLQLVFSSKISSEGAECSSSNLGQGNSNELPFQYTKVQVNDISIFGRFIKYGIIDGKSRIIENKDITKDPDSNVFNSAESLESLMAIAIPNYVIQVQLDPDFSVLIDSKPADSDSENATCSPTTDDGGLTKTQLIGIIIGAVAFGLIIIAISSFFIYKKVKYNSSFLSLRSKLSRN